MNEQVLTVEETKRVIKDFTDLCGGPEQGVRSVSSLYQKAVELRAFLLSKGYPTSQYDIETKYRP